MTTFRKLLTLASVGLTVLAILGLRSDPEIPSDPLERVGATACHGSSAKCMIEIRYAYPAGDLSVVPLDVYF
jgi:hypothetical protein